MRRAAFCSFASVACPGVRAASARSSGADAMGASCRSIATRPTTHRRSRAAATTSVAIASGRWPPRSCVTARSVAAFAVPASSATARAKPDAAASHCLWRASADAAALSSRASSAAVEKRSVFSPWQFVSTFNVQLVPSAFAVTPNSRSGYMSGCASSTSIAARTFPRRT